MDINEGRTRTKNHDARETTAETRNRKHETFLKVRVLRPNLLKQTCQTYHSLMLLVRFQLRRLKFNGAGEVECLQAFAQSVWMVDFSRVRKPSTTP
jgi:hypothetical protein